MSQEVPEPFKITVDLANGGQKTYLLMRKNVVLRGGRTLPIYYFVLESRPSQPDPNKFEYTIKETVRSDVPEDTLEVVGRAMMEYLGMSAEVAAEVNGRFAAELRGYGKDQKKAETDALRRKLLEPPL